MGMGCLAGPVVVCAVMLGKAFYLKKYPKLAGLKESKLMSSRQRELFLKELMKIKNFKYTISYSYPKTIDRVNIYQTARKAMVRSISRLAPKKGKAVVLVDGKTKISGIDFDQMAIIKGDQKIFTIACASIIAKVFRDRMMARYAKKFPGYGFEIHKGYGTKFHYAQLTSLGPSPIHRRSFRLG